MAKASNEIPVHTGGHNGEEHLLESPVHVKRVGINQFFTGVNINDVMYFGKNAISLILMCALSSCTKYVGVVAITIFGLSPDFSITAELARISKMACRQRMFFSNAYTLNLQQFTVGDLRVRVQQVLFRRGNLQHDGVWNQQDARYRGD